LQLARDNGLILDAGAAAITSDAAGSVAYVDLGSDYDKFPLLIAQLNITAIVTNDNDETYSLSIQSSDTTSFTVVRGVSTLLLRASDSTAVVGAYHLAHIPRGRYVRLYNDVGGTTPSVTYGGKAYLNTFPGS